MAWLVPCPALLQLVYVFSSGRESASNIRNLRCVGHDWLAAWFGSLGVQVENRVYQSRAFRKLHLEVAVRQDGLQVLLLCCAVLICTTNSM